MQFRISVVGINDFHHDNESNRISLNVIPNCAFHEPISLLVGLYLGTHFDSQLVVDDLRSW